MIITPFDTTANISQDCIEVQSRINVSRAVENRPRRRIFFALVKFEINEGVLLAFKTRKNIITA
jgi:hypothetical protein